MKELSTEDKAKAYDKAIERANELLYVSDKESLQYQTIKHILPELIESEGEKIRKELIQRVIHDGNGRYTYNKNDYITWLEKQGEHANFRSKIQVGDKVTRNEAGMLVNISQLNRIAKPAKKRDEQKPTWSEEDENMLNTVIKSCDQCGNGYAYYWLKSIKDRCTWKPSEVQMQCLQDLIDFYEAHSCGITTLKSLYNDLKQLKQL